MERILTVPLGGTPVTEGSSSFDPKHGWVEELEESRTASKTSVEQDPLSYARIARAHFMLRQFKKCLTAANLALSLCSGGDEEEDLKRMLKTMKQEAQRELEIPTRARDDSGFKSFDASLLRRNGPNVDTTPWPHHTYQNSNILQCAGLVGDLGMMEALIARGAAIDFPFLDQEPVVAPTSATLLVMLCAGLAFNSPENCRSMPMLMTNEDNRRALEKHAQCATQLVWLGANCDAKLILPQQQSPHMQIEIFRGSMGFGRNLNGKTARELARISGRNELIYAMNQMSSKQNKIEKAHCRCGSHLPWRKCHAGGKHQSVPHAIDYHGEHGDILCFRYSPLALCPCKNTDKTYFKCCWVDTPSPRYQRDDCAHLVGNETVLLDENNLMGDAVVRVLQHQREQGRAPDAPLFDIPPGMGGRQAADLIRSAPSFMRESIRGKCAKTRPSVVLQWDFDVFAGCIERLDDFFIWDDLHWGVAESELLIRVEEWNTALEGYMEDNASLYGGRGSAQYNSVKTLHQASPYAPCANPACQTVETSVKELSKCSRCRKVAYCSRSCQRKHWGTHKTQCIPC